jgi:hypothetical protein
MATLKKSKKRKKKAISSKQVDEILGPSRMEGPATERLATEHVIRPGDTTRAPTEEETLAEQFSGAPLDRNEETVLEIANRLITSITALRGSRKRWRQISHAQRTALLGALSALQEVTGQEKEGVPITLSRWLGIDPRTGIEIGA